MPLSTPRSGTRCNIAIPLTSSTHFRFIIRQMLAALPSVLISRSLTFTVHLLPPRQHTLGRHGPQRHHTMAARCVWPCPLPRFPSFAAPDKSSPSVQTPIPVTSTMSPTIASCTRTLFCVHCRLTLPAPILCLSHAHLPMIESGQASTV